MLLLWMCFGICILATTATSSSFRAQQLAATGGGGSSGLPTIPLTDEGSALQQCLLASPNANCDGGDSAVSSSSSSKLGSFGLGYWGVWAVPVALLSVLSGVTAPALTLFGVCTLAPK